MRGQTLLFVCTFAVSLSAFGQVDSVRMPSIDGVQISSIDGVQMPSADGFSAALSDIMEMLVERDPDADLEQAEELLLDLQRHPIDLNRATTEQLEQLFWLTPEQIDALLLYVDHQPMQTVYELQLVSGFREWDIWNLLPFVKVLPTDKSHLRPIGDYLRRASHELDLRLDARNVEQIAGDPVYGQLRYALEGGAIGGRGIRLGAVVKRDAGEIPDRNSRYGAYLQINDVWRLKTIVAGDYRAAFGLGLVMNSAMPMGKSSMAANLGMAHQGLRKYSGASDEFLRGAGATLRLGRVDLSAFYSMRMPRSMAGDRLEDSGWGQTAGMNALYRHNRLRLGLTAVNYWAKDSARIRNNYYNGHYWRGRNQLAGSLFFQYRIRSVMLLGEVAAAQNTHWGGAGIAGARWAPVPDVQLMLLGRYYSPWYDAHYASAFGETSRNNDEHGIYLGADITRLRRWRFSVYSDFFAFSGPKYMIRDSLTWGYDLFAQATYMPNKRLEMLFRARDRRKGQKDFYSFRWQMTNRWRSWLLRTQLDANLCRPDLPPLKLFAPLPPLEQPSELSYGVSLMEQLEYRAERLPLVAQVRLQGFYIPWYDNRVYAYENDVLYAFSIPMVYGIGARYYANLRYRIGEHVSVYLRLSDTWYARCWAAQSEKPVHKTDVHFLLRLRW